MLITADANLLPAGFGIASTLDAWCPEIAGQLAVTVDNVIVGDGFGVGDDVLLDIIAGVRTDASREACHWCGTPLLDGEGEFVVTNRWEFRGDFEYDGFIQCEGGC
jgi:hypothetical protein